MHTASSTAQVVSPFGSGYVQEHHADETHRYFGQTEPSTLAFNINAAVSSMTGAMFNEAMKSLRGALSLPQQD